MHMVHAANNQSCGYKPIHAAGFTLIELMIVTVILGILLSLAIPTFAVYAARAKVSECLYAAASMKTAISEVAMQQPALGFPVDAAKATIAPELMANLQYCKAASYASTGVLTLPVDEAALGISGTIEMQLVPTLNSGSITWDCRPGASSVTKLRYLPPECRN